MDGTEERREEKERKREEGLVEGGRIEDDVND